MISIADKAHILISALPNIQRYHGKTVVVKYGGNAMINEEIKDAVMSDIVLLNTIGIKVVLVHGGGPEINDMLKRLNIESKFIEGLRYTDDETVEVVQMVLAGKVNKSLCSLLNTHGGKAIGLCGMDAKLIIAAKKKGKVDLGNVGEIQSIDATVIRDALEKGYIPVVATVGMGSGGEVYNINADTAAAAIAGALGAENLILMTDIKGLLRDVADENSLIPEVKLSEVPALKRLGIIGGGMIPKVECCVEAVRQGVKQALIMDGRIPHSILMEILTDEGVGTLFK